MENVKLKELYSAFFRIGILTFGGGLTMLPMLKYEIVEKKKWTTEEELIDCYAIGQCTPGIIAVNTATYVGYKKRGIKGGIFATLGMITPSIVIITLVALCLKQFIGNVWVQHALMGVRGIVCALMLNTVLTLAKKSLVNPICYVICVLGLVLAMFSPIPTVCIVFFAAFVGIFYQKFVVKTMFDKKDSKAVSENTMQEKSNAEKKSREVVCKEIEHRENECKGGTPV